jgi:curved DNA-binding protein CbpA
MQAAPSHYEILGVPRDAAPAALTEARNRLAHANHPDRNLHDVRLATLRTQAINAAYEVLSDPERRRRYDAELAEREVDGFEFVCGNVTISRTGAQLRYATGRRTGDIRVDSITRVLVRPHAFASGSATLLIVTTSGRHRFRLPEDAAAALAGAITSN